MEPTENDISTNECSEITGETVCEGNCETYGCSFKQLFADFISGTPIKRKAWRGYWKYHFGVIEMHCKDGKVINFSESEDIIFTISGILQNDWEIAYNYNCDVPVK